jgi:DNA ligase-1
LENTTDKFPDVIQTVMEALGGKDPRQKVTSVIIDCEVVAYDDSCTECKKIKSFQSLSARGRKDITLENIKVPVCLFLVCCT